MYTYTGGANLQPGRQISEYKFDDPAAGKLDRDVIDGWAAMIQHYFLAAYVHRVANSSTSGGKRLPNGRAVIGTYTPAKTVESGPAPASWARYSWDRSCRVNSNRSPKD